MGSYTIKSIIPCRFDPIEDAHFLALNDAQAEVKRRKADAQAKGRTETIILQDASGRTLRKENVWVPSKPVTIQVAFR